MHAPSHSLPLFDRFPDLAARLPRVAFGALPTPVEPIELPAGAMPDPPPGGLWVKRDDLTGALYGGNKVRKLEFVLGEALEAGYDAVWTVGAIGSHHALATALYGREVGLEVNLLHFPQPVTPHVVDNLKGMVAAGARMNLATRRAAMPAVYAADAARRWIAGRPPELRVPAGGSSLAGVLGYVNAAFELAAQVEAGVAPLPARIVVPVGTCGTFAGLWLGARLAGLPTEVVGVRVVDLLVANRVNAARLINRAAAHLHRLDPNVPRVEARPGQIAIRHAYAGTTYGAATPEGERAQALFGEAGLKLDPTYTSKTAAGLLDELGRPNLRPRGPTLFWLTLSSVDLSPLIADVTREDLPAEYRDFLEKNR